MSTSIAIPACIFNLDASKVSIFLNYHIVVSFVANR